MEHSNITRIPVNDHTPLRGRRHFLVDIPFLLLTLTLVALGLIMMFSASYARAFMEEEGNSAYYFIRQAIFAILGIAVMLFVSQVPMKLIHRLSVPSYWFSILLLAAVLVVGSSAGGAKRWINLGFATFQPSEIAKAGVVLSFAARIIHSREKMNTFRYGVLPFGLSLLLVAFLLYFEPHLSATIIICAVGAAMMFMGGTKVRWFVILGLLAFAAFSVLTASGYTADRISAWKNPWADQSDTGYQVVQSLYAIGSGGLFGLGFGKSRQKYLYLPEEHNDYIFPIVCEELGFVGATLIILLFVLLIIRGYWIAMHAKNRFGALLAGGFTTLLMLQVFLNIAVVTNFLPATGISLPFFSYGGTALLIQLLEMGVILNVSRTGDNNLL